MLRSSLFAAVTLTGCSQQPTEPPATETTTTPVVAIAPQPPAPEAKQPVVQPPPPEAKQPPAPPPVFAFPTDLAGQAVAKAVAPSIPVRLPNEKFGLAPRPRVVPTKYLDPDATQRVTYAPAPVLPPKPPTANPVSPPEKVPVDLGFGADAVPAKPVLPVAAVVTERARDVNIPPAAPMLGRPLNSRVPFDDPTSETGNTTIVNNAAKVILGVSGFLKLDVPNPFELSEQVKPAIPATAEPSALPVPVNPQRLK